MCGGLACGQCTTFGAGPPGALQKPKGSFYIDTVANCIYVNTGTTWIEVGCGAGANQTITDILCKINGGGAAIAAGTVEYVRVDFACTIKQVTLLGDQSGSITCNILKCTFAQFDAGTTHPVLADSITAADTPVITASTKFADSTLTGWTTAINAGDILAFQIPALATNIQKLTIALEVQKT